MGRICPTTLSADFSSPGRVGVRCRSARNRRRERSAAHYAGGRHVSGPVAGDGSTSLSTGRAAGDPARLERAQVPRVGARGLAGVEVFGTGAGLSGNTALHVTPLETDAARLATAEAHVTASGLGHRDLDTVVIAMELRTAGWQVRPPFMRGGQWWFTAPDGRRLSLSAIRELLRLQALLAQRCETCKEPMLHRLSPGRRRSGRVDRRYCSSACRQHAYRERKRDTVAIDRTEA